MVGCKPLKGQFKVQFCGGKLRGLFKASIHTTLSPLWRDVAAIIRSELHLLLHPLRGSLWILSFFPF
ncbi:hypothetical protein PBY51_007083 [Eleginops maclovinus]|uniref:Uncharacterized protein n=1 Tax=Eleginops maclovinus TaxID=56733 RepID=A0AAN7X2F1_ELEMC|nr:hypothetical protein PBY51_007083 [Eleginops maclovinus]